MRSLAALGTALGCALFLSVGCGTQGSSTLTSPEVTRFVFTLNDSTEAEFHGKRLGDVWHLFNGVESIAFEPLNDTVWRVPVFNGSWVLKPNHDSQYTGYWVDSLRIAAEPSYQVPLIVFSSDSSRDQSAQASAVPDGSWDVWFNKARGGDADAQLDVQNSGGRLHGTMRTPTGDYRFLSGKMNKDRLQLQTFDGAHLYVFTATLFNNQWINGDFYSGNHYHTTWSAEPAGEPVDHDPMVSLAVSKEELYARFLTRSGLEDTLFLHSATNELIVLDILGTWCPNCMDEIRLLRELDQKDARFVSIAFERDTVPNSVYRRLDEFTSEMNADWEVYWGGAANKLVAADAFPFIDVVTSFPTTLFIRGNQVNVHSGFNGPATGSRYDQEKERFQKQLNGITSLESH